MQRKDLDSRDHWKEEWYIAEKEGETQWATTCKNKYRDLVMAALKEEPSMWHIEKLKALPTIYLN